MARLIGIEPAAREPLAVLRNAAARREKEKRMSKIPLKVLIVEDSDDDAELLVHELERAGYQPTTTNCPSPAVAP